MTKSENLIARAATLINAPVSEVWEALVSPRLIEQYMFGTHVVSDWRQGSPITWQGEWQGQEYEDKGEILNIEENRVLQYSHYSPLSGEQDLPENYHTVTIKLVPDGQKTRVTLAQDNNADEEARQHSEQNWQTMLDGLKNVAEGPGADDTRES